MNLKQLSLAALAFMTLFACSSDEPLGGTGENGAPKAVYMKLEGISAPAAIGRSTDLPTEGEEAAVNVSDVAVIFYQEGGNITDVYTVSSDEILKKDGVEVEDAQKPWTNLVDIDGSTVVSGYRFIVGHKADKVMVLGNYANLDKTTNIKTVVVKGGPISKVTAFKIPLSSQNVPGGGDDKTTKACVTLYGDGAMKVKQGDKDPEDEDFDVYEAEVEIRPIISRVEITSLGCEFNKEGGTAGTATEHLYTSVTVKGIGMVDYYNTATLGENYTDQMTTKTTSNTKGLIVDPESKGEAPEGGYKFCASSGQDDWEWAYDIIGSPNGIRLTPDETGSNSTKYVCKNSAQDEKEDCATFAYNFFPKDEIANIRVWVETQKSEDAAKESFVVTANFKNQEQGGTVVKPEAGNIYKFDYVFNETVPGVWDKDQKVVYVKVKVLKWKVQTVYPDFH